MVLIQYLTYVVKNICCFISSSSEVSLFDFYFYKIIYFVLYFCTASTIKTALNFALGKYFQKQSNSTIS